MNKLKIRLSAYRKSLNMCGIEKELELPPRTIKKWLSQNTVPSQEIQDRISKHLEEIGKPF